MKRHVRTLLFLFLALVVLHAPAAAQATSAEEKARKIDEMMQTVHARRQFNGSVLVADDGKVIFRKGYGLANMEWNIPNAPDTKFRLGSITKQFTSMLVLRQAERGKIKLDGKLSDYLPYYRKDTGDQVTIHQLLTHTSGIPTYTARPDMEKLGRQSFGVEEFVKQYCSGDLEFTPGSRFAYDNSGYFLLGAILEQVSGKKYEELLREEILTPLGMKDTGYDHWETILPKRAAGYSRRLTGFVTDGFLDMSIPYAAGSLYSTVDDLYKWDQALYTDKLLSAEWKQKMWTPEKENYAYGWIVVKPPAGPNSEIRTVTMHGGGINGFNTLIFRILESHQLIVLLNNTGGAPLGPLQGAILNILNDRPYSLPPQPVADALWPIIRDQGADAAIAKYREWKAGPQGLYNFGEPQLNTLGYALLGAGRTQDAIAIFKLNVEVFLQSANVYDSLGEAYAAAGQKDLAIQNYEKSLQLNPRNTGAADALKKLKGQ